MVQSGQRLGNALYTQSLAVALAQAGDFSEALKTIEYALSANFNEPVFRPEGLRLRAELHAQTGETRLAEDGLLEAIALVGRTTRGRRTACCIDSRKAMAWYEPRAKRPRGAFRGL